MDFKNPTSPPAAKLLAKVSSDVREIVQMDETKATRMVVATNRSMARAMRGVNVKIATLANIAHVLGYEVIIRFRELPEPVQAVRPVAPRPEIQ